jgi:hypothetical protein
MKVVSLRFGYFLVCHVCWLELHDSKNLKTSAAGPYTILKWHLDFLTVAAAVSIHFKT